MDKRKSVEQWRNDTGSGWGENWSSQRKASLYGVTFSFLL